MATKVKGTNATSVILNKVSHIYAQVDTGDIFDFEDVLRNSTKLSQNDNTTSDIENEVSDDAIKTLVTLGKFQFETTLEDIQSDIVTTFMGFTADNTTGIVAAPDKYIDKYAKIVVVIPNGTKNVGFIMPKVQLNTKAIIESLNSALAGVSLKGTARSTSITYGSTTEKTPMLIDYDYKLPTDATTDLAAMRTA